VMWGEQRRGRGPGVARRGTDGGDPWVHQGTSATGDQAQGVTSGGWGDCASGGRTWFQPVNEILWRYGLTLHTA
jgi:hypothetical protein